MMKDLFVLVIMTALHNNVETHFQLRDSKCSAILTAFVSIDALRLPNYYILSTFSTFLTVSILTTAIVWMAHYNTCLHS